MGGKEKEKRMAKEILAQAAETTQNGGSEEGITAGSLQEETSSSRAGSLQEETPLPGIGSLQEETPLPGAGSLQEETSPSGAGSLQEETSPSETESRQEGPARDAVKAELLEIAEHVGGQKSGGRKAEQEQGEDPYFDKLPVKWKEKDSKPIVGNEGAQKVKEQIGGRRESPLYQAVLVSRLLKENKPNPMASGIFSRAVNSSAWTNIGDLNAGITGATGLLSTFDKNAKSQTVYQSISLVTNFITVISSIRNIYQKVKGLQFKKSADAWIGNLFLGIGILGDFSLAFAKSVAMAKTIAKFCKKDLPILNKISNWMFLATGTSQAIALMNLSRGLAKSFAGIQKLEMAKAQLWVKAKMAVHGALGKGNGARLALQAGSGGEEDAAASGEETASGQETASGGETASGQEAASGKETASGEEKASGGVKREAAPMDEKAKKKRMNEMKKKDAKKEETRLIKAKKALQVLNEQENGENPLPGQNQVEEHKDDLVKYIGLSKRIKKQKHDTAGMVASGINLALGLGASVITGGKFVTAQGAARTRKDGWKTANTVMGYAAMGAGLAANTTTLAVTGVRVGSRLTNQADDRSRAVEERLFDKLETLGDNRHGLKYLESSLEGIYGPGAENNQDIAAKEGQALQDKAKETLRMYEDTEKMFDLMGAPVGKLAGAKNLEEFKKILVSGLV